MDAKKYIKIISERFSKEELSELVELFDSGEIDDVFYGIKSENVKGLIHIDAVNYPEKYEKG